MHDSNMSHINCLHLDSTGQNLQILLRIKQTLKFQKHHWSLFNRDWFLILHLLSYQKPHSRFLYYTYKGIEIVFSAFLSYHLSFTFPQFKGSTYGRNIGISNTAPLRNLWLCFLLLHVPAVLAFLRRQLYAHSYRKVLAEPQECSE